LFLNSLANGKISVTLAKGTQSFVLFMPRADPPSPHVLAIFLEHETTPAFTALLSPAAPSLQPSRFATVMGLDGTPVPNNSGLSAERRGFRVTLLRAEFPRPGPSLDATGPWQLRPDNVFDAVGVITLQVEPLQVSAPP
jgi:hypothetical protein